MISLTTSLSRSLAETELVAGCRAGGGEAEQVAVVTPHTTSHWGDTVTTITTSHNLHVAERRGGREGTNH